MSLSAKRTALKPGDVLGAYQLLLPIGEGGMGRVWVAREKQAGPFPRWVAIKTALAEDSKNRQFWNVLLDEAHIASRLRHPNVCAIHAVETERSVVYLVMDWSDAGSLREVLDAAPEGRMLPQLAARIMASVCAGLHAAHELSDDDGTPLGVVHRDVSPQNILFSTSGQVKMADFGVAKARGQLHEATRTGEVKGKLSYMAPEQVTTKDIDRRADVFALGCVLYEATLGKRPFHGNDALATLYSLLEQPLKPPHEIDPEYPPGLEAILLKALERDPNARYQTAEALGYALESWMSSVRAIVTEAQVAGLLRDTLGPRIKQRTAELQEMIRKIDDGSLEIAEAATGSDSSRSSTQLTAQVSDSPPAGRSRATLTISLLAGLAALAVGVWWSGGVGAAAAPSGAAALTAATPLPSSVPAPPPPPQQPATVTISLQVEPDSASVQIDEGAPQSAPLTLSVPADGKLHSVRASAKGFHAKSVSVVFDRDQQVSIDLEPASRGTRGRVLPVASATAAAAATPQVVAPRRPTDELPAVVEKAPRFLDSDNPFAK